MKKLFYITFLVLFSINAYSTDYPVTCSGNINTTLGTALASASSGDTVSISAGSCSISSTQTIPEGVTVQGDSITTTIITNSGTALKMLSDSSKVLDMKFTYTSSPTGVILIYGSNDFVVGNVHFQRSSYSSHYAIYCQGHSSGGYEPTGVIYGSIFNNGGKVFAAATLGQYLASDPHTADVEWADRDITLGSDRAVYVEDCTHDKGGFGNVIDGQYGGSYVFRYNTVTSGYIEAHSAGGRLETSDLRNRATRHWEIYGNDLSDTEASWRPMRIRGGTGVIFGNTISDDYDNDTIYLDDVRIDNSYCTPSSLADGGGTGGYPCRDQIGSGYDVSEWTTSNQYPAQTREPAYLWDNSHAAVTADAQIQQNRDFYDGADDDGHMDVGTWAERPGSCTNGDGYWATNKGGNWNTSGNEFDLGSNDGALYVCAGGDFTDPTDLHYTPYDYPHPLRSEIATITISNPQPTGTVPCE